MTRDECKRRAISLARVPAGKAVEASQAADKWLEPYVTRDETVVDGKGLVDVVDPETWVHRTQEIQIHAPRRVAPFVFSLAEVNELARAIRRGLGIR
jgi:hypothetical protein